MSRTTRRSPFTCAGKDTLTKIVCLLGVLSHVFAQTDSSFTFPDFTPTIDVSLTKVFTTTVVIVFNNVSQGAFNETVFKNAANSFYSGAFSESLPVTASLNRRQIKSNTSTEISYQVNYDISYNYTQLITIAGTDSVIQTSIGDVSAVKNGFEGISSFSDMYTLSDDPSNFSFTGNRICPSVSCASTLVFCNESELGLSPVCRSNCFSRTICQNGASCVQDSANRSPSCNCLGSGSVWYIGQYCEYKVEVWMIVVFLVLYLLLIAVILAIGCWCWKRVGKTRRENTLKMERRKASPLMTQTKADVSQNPRRGRNNESLVRNTQLRTEPLRAPSPLSRIPEETTGAASDVPASVDMASDRQSEISRHSRTTSQSSSESEEGYLRPFQTVNYDSRANDVGITTSPHTTEGSSGNKSTQTNTQINLHLSDSILARNISQ